MEELAIEFDVKAYRQKKMTCGISCMNMVLEYFKIISKANAYYEKRYEKIYASKIVEGVPFSAIAYHFAKNNLKTEIIHSEKNYFDNSYNYYPNDIFERAIEEYILFIERAKSKKAKVLTNAIIDCNFFKKSLEEKKLIILAGQIDNSLHAILICGYKNGNFIICDPLLKDKQIISEYDICKFKKTNIGEWCITIQQ